MGEEISEDNGKKETLDEGAEKDSMEAQETPMETEEVPMKPEDASGKSEKRPPDESKGSWKTKRRDAFFAAVGLLLGAGLDFAVRSDLNRQESLRESRREAYGSFLEWTVEEMFGGTEAETKKYQKLSVDARKKIALFGSASTVKALGRYWRHFERPTCCGPLEQVRDDAALYRSMREDSLSWWSDGVHPRSRSVSDEDLMLLVQLCLMPKDETEAVVCRDSASREGGGHESGKVPASLPNQPPP